MPVLAAMLACGFDPNARDKDHVGVARVLIAAGSSLEWQAPEGAPDQERTIEGLLDLRRLAEGAAT